MKYIGLLLLIGLFMSCTSKEDYIKEYAEFINDVECNYKNYNEEQWSEADEQFSEFSEKDYFKFKDKLTEEERDTLDILDGIYLGIKARVEAGNNIRENE